MEDDNIQTGTIEKHTGIIRARDGVGQINSDASTEDITPPVVYGISGRLSRLDMTQGAYELYPLEPRRGPVERSPAIQGNLDKSLLERAESIIDSFNSDDVVESVINLEALRGIILGLWKSAKNSHQYHQDILSTLENAILSKNDFTGEDMALFREAVRDLKNKHLVEGHVKIISESFINQGFSPLAFLSEIKDGDDSK